MTAFTATLAASASPAAVNVNRTGKVGGGGANSQAWKPKLLGNITALFRADSGVTDDGLGYASYWNDLAPVRTPGFNLFNITGTSGNRAQIIAAGLSNIGTGPALRTVTPGIRYGVQFNALPFDLAISTPSANPLSVEVHINGRGTINSGSILPAVGTVRLITIIFTASNQVLFYVNGVLAATKTLTGTIVATVSVLYNPSSISSGYSFLIQASQFGLNHSAQAYPFLGDIALFSVQSYEQPLAERQQFEGWALWNWGLQSLLPSGHPYISNPPLLDNGPSAVAPLAKQKLSTGKVKMGGPRNFTLTDIGNSLVANFDLSRTDLVTASATDQTISNIASVNGALTLTQPTSTSAFVYTANAVNNLSAGLSDGSCFLITDNPYIAGVGFAIFIVFVPINNSNIQYSLLTSTAGNRYISVNTATGTLTVAGAFGSQTVLNALYTNVPNILSFSDPYQSATSNYFAICMNGNGDNFPGATNGGRYIGPLDSIVKIKTPPGYLCQVIRLTGNISKAVQQQIEGFLYWKWNGILPSTHPYFSAPPNVQDPAVAATIALLYKQNPKFVLSLGNAVGYITPVNGSTSTSYSKTLFSSTSVQAYYSLSTQSSQKAATASSSVASKSSTKLSVLVATPVSLLSNLINRLIKSIVSTSQKTTNAIQVAERNQASPQASASKAQAKSIVGMQSPTSIFSVIRVKLAQILANAASSTFVGKSFGILRIANVSAQSSVARYISVLRTGSNQALGFYSILKAQLFVFVANSFPIAVFRRASPKNNLAVANSQSIALKQSAAIKVGNVQVVSSMRRGFVAAIRLALTPFAYVARSVQHRAQGRSLAVASLATTKYFVHRLRQIVTFFYKHN